jgi:hypothetical protein
VRGDTRTQRLINLINLLIQTGKIQISFEFLRIVILFVMKARWTYSIWEIWSSQLRTRLSETRLGCLVHSWKALLSKILLLRREESIILDNHWRMLSCVFIGVAITTSHRIGHMNISCTSVSLPLFL